MGIVTISRGSYSRGKEIAEKLAETLGYRCVSREILLKASKEFDVPEVQLIQAIQDAPSFFDRLKHGKKKYLAFIREAFLECVMKDDVVYHGFAGHFFTQDVPGILKVRIIANFNYRTNIIMKRENISEEEARKLLDKIDSERRKWGMYLYSIDPSDPSLYDIVLRVDCLGVDECVESLIDLAKCPCFQTTDESMKKLKDLHLAAKATSRLVWKFPDANVKCKDGVVMVSLESSLKKEAETLEYINEQLKDLEDIKELKTFVIPFET